MKTNGLFYVIVLVFSRSKSARGGCQSVLIISFKIILEAISLTYNLFVYVCK